MAKEVEIDVRATGPGTPEAAFALLADGSTWPRWSPVDQLRLERPAPDGGDGVGAVRALTSGRVTGYDTIVALEPGRRFAYTHESKLPVEDYRAEVTLTAAANGGTEVRWHATFRPRYPGTGWALRASLGRFLRQCAEGLAAEAGRP